MKISQKYKCKKCGMIAPIEEALTPPSAGEPAKPKPCPACGESDWGACR